MKKDLENQANKPRVVEVEVPRQMPLGEHGDVIAARGRYDNRKFTNVAYSASTFDRGGDDNLDWGYVGTGSLDFAESILMHFTNHDKVVTRAFRDEFCLEFLANMPKPGGRIPKEFIFDFIAKMKETKPELVEAQKRTARS
jgi:hypothetical protein